MAELIELQEIIEKLRDKLHEIAQGKPLTDMEVVRASQMLDGLLTEYQRMLSEKIPKQSRKALQAVEKVKKIENTENGFRGPMQNIYIGFFYRHLGQEFNAVCRIILRKRWKETIE